MTDNRKLRRALVTGGSGGIGSAICRQLAADGFHVIVHANRNLDAATATASAIASAGGSAEAAYFDVTDSKVTATALETLLSLTLKWAEQANVPLPKALKKITSDPATLLGLSVGQFKVGAPADVCIFNPQAFWVVTAQTLVSQGKNTPYLGRELQGKVTHTLVNGRIVHPS